MGKRKKTETESPPKPIHIGSSYSIDPTLTEHTHALRSTILYSQGYTYNQISTKMKIAKGSVGKLIRDGTSSLLNLALYLATETIKHKKTTETLKSNPLTDTSYSLSIDPAFTYDFKGYNLFAVDASRMRVLQSNARRAKTLKEIAKLEKEIAELERERATEKHIKTPRNSGNFLVSLMNEELQSRAYALESVSRALRGMVTLHFVDLKQICIYQWGARCRKTKGRCEPYFCPQIRKND